MDDRDRDGHRDSPGPRAAVRALRAVTVLAGPGPGSLGAGSDSERRRTGSHGHGPAGPRQGRPEIQSRFRRRGQPPGLAPGGDELAILLGP